MMAQRRVKTPALVFCLALAYVTGTGAREVQENASPRFEPLPADIARPEGFPAIGKWMIAPDLSYAHWFGAVYKGKRLREPVNVIIVDGMAASSGDAVDRLLKACAVAGYSARRGHSGGYFGWLDGRLFPQIPSGRYHALADEPFELHNNHGRFFGPCRWKGRFYWMGSLSREKMDLASRAKHDFVSFNSARDGFARALARKAGYRIVGYLSLRNAIREDPLVGTGDHDAFAVVLTATR
jgi:hypothetical protein